ncbi:hypothetical protein F5Y17DRAFT_169444 [Xylariaceae sp. FL0594]|nr:hypothetical protein F5Y17DRAFT_169444 [Xylariaceae sp. FL0594]
MALQVADPAVWTPMNRPPRRERSTTIEFFPFPLIVESDDESSTGSEEPPRRRASSVSRPRSISAMDGPSSRYSSLSTAPVTVSHFSSHAVAPRQNIQGLVSSAPPVLPSNMDPPRPAKEGHEWVWFPAGYWAERQLVESPSKESIKPFRRRKRSAKSSSELSPKTTPFPAQLIGTRLEKKSDSAGKRLSPSTTTASSGSGNSAFRFNRSSDIPLPSPYLTEEAHVQSLQWPTNDAARTSSISAGSIFQRPSTKSPSPLHILNTEDDKEADSDATPTPTFGRQTPLDSHGKSLQSVPGASTADQDLGQKSRKTPLLNWRMLKVKPKTRDATHTPSPLSGNPVTSPSEAGSTTIEETSGSPKNRSVRLFHKKSWRRKVSDSSVKSNSSSVRESLRSWYLFPAPVAEKEERPGRSDADPHRAVNGMLSASNWRSEFPGGEAMRILTPNVVESSINKFSTSFFPDMPNTSQRHNSPPRKDEQKARKMSALSSAFTTGVSSSSTTPKPNKRKYQTQRKDTAGGISGSGSDGSVIKDKKKQERQQLDDDTKRAISGSSSALSKSHEGDGSRKDWSGVPTTVPSYEFINRTVTENTMRTFAFDLAEHLPSSPMCPINKRHKSGGTGVCVYHGRAKRSGTVSEKSADNAPDGTGRKSTESPSTDGDDDEAGSDVWK